ncbi:E-selectin-like isoform X2 [Branchiostoma floridae x Branchiostoma belcheri]
MKLLRCLPLLLLISALVLESDAWWWSRRRRTDSAHRYCPEASTPWHTYKLGCRSPYTEGETCYYRCKHSYTHISGSTTRTCSDGAWTGSIMTCRRVQTCTAPPTPDNAYISGCDSPYINHERCIYHCNSGYIHVWGNAIRACINRQWYGYDIDCRKGSFCPVFPYMANTIMSGCSAPFTYGDVCTFRCESGYNQVSGNTTRTCSNGAWTGTDLVCEIGPTCNRPPELPNTRWSDCYYPFTEGETCIYSCDFGSNRVNGSTRRTCSNEVWNGTDLFCKRGA